MSQDELAQKSGVSRTAIQNWESGLHGIRGKNLARLKQALRVNDTSMLVADDESDDLSTSAMVRQTPSAPDPGAREVLYEFLDGDATTMEPSLTHREVAWLMDHHVDGQVTPRYFLYAILAERERNRAAPARPPTDRPNEAAGAAERTGVKPRDGVSRKKPARQR